MTIVKIYAIIPIMCDLILQFNMTWILLGRYCIIHMHMIQYTQRLKFILTYAMRSRLLDLSACAVDLEENRYNENMN